MAIAFGLKNVAPSKKRTRMTEEEKEAKYLEDKALIDDLEKQTAPVNGAVTLKYPLFVPSCHNRKPSILENLAQFGDTKVYACIYEHEVDMYTWLDDIKNVTKVIVPKEYLTIQKMRLFIQNYTDQNGIQKYWVTDDDLVDIWMYGKTHLVSAAQGLRMLEILSEGKGYSAIGYGHVDMGCKFWHGGLMSDTYASVTLLYDGKVMKEHNLSYTGDHNVDESLEFIINSHIAGVPVKNCCWGLLHCYEPSGGKNSLASKPENHWHMQESLYIKFGDLVRLRLENRRGYTAGVRYTQFDKPRTYDEKLLALCKAGDHDGVRKYLEAKRNVTAEENY